MKLARKLQQRKHPVRQSSNQNKADDGTGDSKEDKEGESEDKNSSSGTSATSGISTAAVVASTVAASGNQPGSISGGSAHSPQTTSGINSGSSTGKDNNGKDMRRLPQQGKEKCSPRVTLRIHQFKEKSTKGNKGGSASNDVDSFVSGGMDAGKAGEENSSGGLKACDPGGGEDGHDNTSGTGHADAPSAAGSGGGGANTSGGGSGGGGVDDETRSSRSAANDGDGSASDAVAAVSGSTASTTSTTGSNPPESANDSGLPPATVKRSHSSDDDPAPEDGKKRRRKDDKGKASSSTGGSPKSVLGGESEGEDAKSAESPGPKVPPLKIVISGGSLEETGTGGRNGKNGSGRHHLPYVVSAPTDMTESSSVGASAQPSGGSGSGNGSNGGTSAGNGSAATANLTAGDDADDRRSGSGEDATAPSSSNSGGTGRGGHHQRVLRSHRGKKGSNKDSTSSGSGAPSPAGEGGSPRQVSPIPATEAGNDGDDKSTTVPGSSTTGSGAGCEPDKNASPPPPPPAPQELHPRKRKIRARDNGGATGSNNPNAGASSSTVTSGGGGSNTGNNSGSESGSSSEPGCLGGSGGTLPSSTALDSITNSYQLFLNIRKQIERKRKGLFPVQPKPPRGFKDYLMNRCTYVLANNASNRVPPPSNKPPADLHQGLKELYLNQEKERHRLLTQHVIEKEKLVLSVEQEILRVHGRAARALANQALPFSACTILRDEEVYSAITPEQEEKDRNARVRFNGRLFLSWLQDVDDKWEKIKETMLLRHHNEADSLHAVQKMDWEWKMKELVICDFKASPVIDETHVPTVHVSDDFDLLPA